MNGGFAERAKGRLVPTDTGESLVTVLPDALRSPLLTAEWENRLKQIERGELDAETFLADIEHMAVSYTHLEYSAMLQDQLERGNNGLIKSKHITFGIEADGYKTAKPRLERLETDILNNFRKLGVKAEPLDSKARLALMHGCLLYTSNLKFWRYFT